MQCARAIKCPSELNSCSNTGLGNTVYPLAQKRVPIDLDDGVKRNYPLFGDALKPIKGLETTDD